MLDTSIAGRNASGTGNQVISPSYKQYLLLVVLFRMLRYVIQQQYTRVPNTFFPSYIVLHNKHRAAGRESGIVFLVLEVASFVPYFALDGMSKSSAAPVALGCTSMFFFFCFVCVSLLSLYVYDVYTRSQVPICLLV